MTDRPESISLDQLHEATIVGVNLALTDQQSADSIFPDPGPIGMYMANP